MWEVDSEPTQREHLVDVNGESSPRSSPPPAQTDVEYIIGTSVDSFVHDEDEKTELEINNHITFDGINDEDVISNDIVSVDDDLGEQDFNIDIPVSDEVKVDNVDDDTEIIIHTEEKVDGNDDGFDDIVSVDERFDDIFNDHKQSVENDFEIDNTLADDSGALDTLIRDTLAEEVKEEKDSSSESEDSDSNGGSVKDSTLQSSTRVDSDEVNSLESSLKESYRTPSPISLSLKTNIVDSVISDSNPVEESDHKSTDDSIPVFENESDRSDKYKSIDVLIDSGSGSHSPVQRLSSSDLYSADYKSGERSPSNRLNSRTLSSGSRSPGFSVYSPSFRSGSRSPGSHLYQPVFTNGFTSPKKATSLQFFPEDRNPEFLDSFSSTSSSPAQVNQSAVLHGRFAGSFDERIIKKTVNETKVYSERPGGWELNRNELVYPLSEDQWRREARRRKWHGKKTTKEDDVVSFIITVARKSSHEYGDDFSTTLQHKTTAVADQSLPFSKGNENTVSSISFGSSPNIYGSDLIMLRMDDDRRSLVERSESFEASSSPATLIDKNKLIKSKSLDVSTNYPVYAQNKSFEDSENVNLDYSKGVGTSAARRENVSNVRQPKSSVWGNRVNPFDEEPVSEDLFNSGIIDLDYDESKQDTHDAELVDSDSSEGSTHESKLRRLSRSSLSEQEEQINLKTQFKGVYYNIGSTEDLLQDLAADDDKEGDLGIPASHRYLGSKQSSSDESEVAKDPVQTETETEAPVPTPPISRAKGKSLRKYESLDLDIDDSNPFYDDVYSEYGRRLCEKSRKNLDSGSGSGSSSNSGGRRKRLESVPSTLENIPEGAAVTSETNQEDSTNPFEVEDSDEAEPEPEEGSNRCPDADQGANCGEKSTEGRDPDSAPLINQGETDDKENMPLFGKKKKPAESENKDGETMKMENGGVETSNGSVENKNQDDKDHVQLTESDGSGVTVEKKEVDGNVAVTFTAGVTSDPKEEVKEEAMQPSSAETNQSAPVKTEKSPLIGQLEPQDPNVKDSKLRDHSPGFLCCTLL